MTTTAMTATTTLPKQRTSEADRTFEATRVLVVDDHPTVHLGLAAVIAAADGMELAATATSASRGSASTSRRCPTSSSST